MKTLFSVLAAFLLFAAPCYARIGETKEQCDKRYGKPLIRMGNPMPGDDEPGWIYRKAGLNIGITFWEDKADAIHYSKLKKDALDTPVEISENERELLRRANGGSAVWKEIFEVGFLEWSTEDETLISVYDIFEHSFMIFTREYSARFQHSKNKQEADALGGM